MMAAYSAGPQRRGFQSSEGQDPDAGQEDATNHLSLDRVHRLINHCTERENTALSKQSQSAVEINACLWGVSGRPWNVDEVDTSGHIGELPLDPT